MTDLATLIHNSLTKLAAMTPAEREAMWQAQRESFTRAMQPCEHGVYDFETCPDCRSDQPMEKHHA